MDLLGWISAVAILVALVWAAWDKKDGPDY